MKLNSLRLIYFSPTHTTKNTLQSIARGMYIDKVYHLNLTLPEYKNTSNEVITDDFVIIGAPVYGGRLPQIAVDRMRHIKGNGIPAAVVVVYGNRAYEDALIELRDLSQELGFLPVAGGAFIGEHSFASDSVHIANGRPDLQDREKAELFGQAIYQKMSRLDDINHSSTIRVPGQHPYKDHLSLFGNLTPITMEETCNECHTCVSVCPTAAITFDDRIVTSKERCILCCACVKNCPSGSRIIEAPKVEKIRTWLSENFREPKVPEWFLD